MKKLKNNLDEMQEQQLLKIEHNGCWLAFWLLLAAMIIQTAAFGYSDFKTIGGEWIVFMVLALYLAFACVRKGIWDRRIPMTTKSNVIVSCAAGMIMGLINALVISRHFRTGSVILLPALVTAVITFVLCLAGLTVMMKKTEKKQAAMEAEPADADKI